jgi:type IV secretion system protein VirD4
MFGIDLSGLIEQYNNPQGYLMLGAFGVLVVMMLVLKDNKGTITTGRTVQTSDKLSANAKALKQLRLPLDYQPPTLKQAKPKPKPKKNPKTATSVRPQRPRDELTLWAGKPPHFWWSGRWRKLGAQLQTFMGSPPALWLPDAQRSVLVLGSPGSGKTASAIDPMIESALAQGIPVLLYDKKGDQMRLHAPLAARYGYEVHVLAPGEPYSGVFNPVEFLKDSTDAVMAGELGSVIVRNAQSAQGGGRSDEFFSKAGEQLGKALIQLARATPYPDMGMVYALLQLPDVVHRIDSAVQSGQIDPWVAASFNQLLASKDAEKTVSGIMTTTAATFSRFIQKDLLPTFMGPSTLPARIEGKQMIIFKLDDERRSVVGPLLAAAIHLCVVKNLATPRQDPILIALDELPSIRLDRLPNWINEYRSNGGAFVLGIQSLNQLYDTYGDKRGQAIASACATHMLFYPGDTQTAESYSKRFGEKDFIHTQKSTGRTMAGRMSRSITYSESLQKMPLFTPDEILRFRTGECVLTSPGYGSGQETNVPYRLRVPMPKREFQRLKQNRDLWDEYLCPYLTRHAAKVPEDQVYASLQERIAYANELLPPPPAEDE